ncbi:MAG: hypothetical protein AWU57_3627, partial [Marinobacter sp. T13-3]
MRDYLPPIHINVGGPLAHFLERMAAIADKTERFNVEIEHDAMGIDGFSVANFRLKKSKQHKGLGGQLIIQRDSKKEIAVEIRAERWNPQDPPTYETYVKEAKALIGPLLSEYNRIAGTRYRLTVPAKEKLEPKLPPQSHKLFKRFTNLANKTALHPLDWKRFYEFVRNSRMRKPLAEEDMARLLSKEGFPEECAREIAEAVFFKTVGTDFPFKRRLSLPLSFPDSRLLSQQA